MIIQLKNQINIPFTQIINFRQDQNKENEQTANLIPSKSTICVNYNSNQCASIISINGPSEAKMRFKAKNDSAYVQVLTTFNRDVDKAQQNVMNLFLKNFCDSVLHLEEYPRCVISVTVTIISYTSEIELKNHLMNGIMLALTLSGIDLLSVAISVVIPIENTESQLQNQCLITKDANSKHKLLSIESLHPIKRSEFNSLLEKSTDLIDDQYKQFKRLVLSLISN